MNQSDIVSEVRTFFAEMLERGDIVRPSWATAAIIARHQEVRGLDAEWYAVSAYENVREVVACEVRRRKLVPAETPDPQILLPGFKRVQKHYSVEREGEQQIVPVELLTNSEVAEKVCELRAIGKGCFDHADELLRYISDRQQAA